MTRRNETYVLVDFDNVDQSIRRRGALAVIETLGATIMKNLQPTPGLLKFRLYSGWYTDSGLTQRASDVAAEVEKEFPKVMTFASTQSRVLANAVLAYSLLVQPEAHLLHTYRERQSLYGIRTKTSACTDPTCGLRHLKKLVKKGKCPEPSCSSVARDLMWRTEQKLVDGMMAADLVHLAVNQTHVDTAIVTNDEDLWPAIRQALSFSSKVIHIQAKKNCVFPERYTRSLSGTSLYRFFTLGS